MMALFTVLRAAFGYLFLVFLVRVVGRRPGKQLTPFEFVLVFYLGGLTLTGVVGMEMSLTNAMCQIFTLACCHYALTWLRKRFGLVARVLDGTPLLLLENGGWRTRTMAKMRVQDDDVMDAAREKGLRKLEEIETAVLEPIGSISILTRRQPRSPVQGG
ncbi:MAG TPA: YetF domain-containing protein [Terracidiphilus sp.]|nr:YetF domain-containing protein [Terracidiphilus sp.]